MTIDSSGRIGWATWDPISDRSVKTSGLVRMTLHTAVTSSSDIYGPGKGPGGTYAHAYSPLSGNLRQHQEAHHWAYADLNANGATFAVEHQDNAHEMSFSDNQIENDARLFADLVIHSRSCSICNVPNRIATVDDTKGLAWHRLGIDGNFGAYDPSDRTTWCKKQTGQSWSNSTGKLCPYNTRIRQVKDIWELSNDVYLKGGTADTTGDDDMALDWVEKQNLTDVKLVKDEWKSIKVDDHYFITKGPKKIVSGTVNVSIADMTPGSHAMVRLYACDSDGEKITRHRVGEPKRWIPPSTGGTARDVLPFVWDLSGPAKGQQERQLRVEVRSTAPASYVAEIRAEAWVQK